MGCTTFQIWQQEGYTWIKHVRIAAMNVTVNAKRAISMMEWNATSKLIVAGSVWMQIIGKQLKVDEGEKMISSEIYEKVTYKQIDDMKHALGFDNRKVRGTKHRRYEPYRNYFNTGECDVDDWEQLVSIGFATKIRENWYKVSDDGWIFLERVTGVKFLPESD